MSGIRLLRLLGCGLTALVISCDIAGPPEGTVCLAIAIPSIVVEIRDAAGSPAAIGATVTIRKLGREGSAEGFGDPLRVAVHANNEGGVFDVHVQKPWHAERIIRGVIVPAGPCGVLEPVVVRGMISLLPGAPPVHQVVLPPYGYGFGASVCGTRHPITAYVLTAAGVSREALWDSRDEGTVAVERGQASADGANSASLIPQCRLGAGQAFVVARSTADPSVRDSVKVSVWAR
jgi:hypothetical protein